MAKVTKGQECGCCLEDDECRIKMEELDEDRVRKKIEEQGEEEGEENREEIEGKMEGECITLHPGFSSVCLDEWVLETAAVRLKTRANKSYATQLKMGKTTKSR